MDAEGNKASKSGKNKNRKCDELQVTTSSYIILQVKLHTCTRLDAYSPGAVTHGVRRRSRSQQWVAVAERWFGSKVLPTGSLSHSRMAWCGRGGVARLRMGDDSQQFAQELCG